MWLPSRKIRVRLHLFNPENDLALAADIERYTPPAAAVALARCGQLLPAWLADAGDAILVADTETASREAEELRSRFGIDVSPVSHAPADVAGCSPWGWSRYARRRFADAGVRADMLPDDDTLDRYRRLSSRTVTVDLCRCLGLEPPVVAYDADGAMAAVAANEERGAASYLKMPWSSSGRGVFTTARMTAVQTERRAADIIRSQGLVMIEPDRRRVADFAALYRIEDGEARFYALSVFATDERGAYRGNLVLPDSAIIDRLGVDPMPPAMAMADALSAVVAPCYTGWAGVDMVVTSYGSVWPCIELNLRATMGVVAAAMRPYFSDPMLLAPSPANPRSFMPCRL